MRFFGLSFRSVGILVLALLVPLAVLAQEAAAAPGAPVGRFLVKLRAGTISGSQGSGQVATAARRAGLQVVDARHIVAGIHLLQVEGAAAEQTLARLRADPEIEYAEVDQRRYAQAVPDDPLFSGQWYLQNAEPAAVNALQAWDLTTGSDGVVIAELDTGVRFEHPDLRTATGNRLLPGYDMIGPNSQGDFLTANDGNGRDPDASDPGDWVSAADMNNALFAKCTIAGSSWHGTRVAGILGAIANNGTGIAGMDWSGWILPVRVLGKCGGYDSDIIAGMAWAAGNHVDGVPDNPYPARIVNMSLSGKGACPQSYQQVVDELVAEGVLIVASAGNEGGPVDAPANCVGVAAIAGLRQVGTKVGFSSLGPEISLSAPGGNCVNTKPGEPCLFSIVTTSDTGTTAPGSSTYTDQTNANLGTSFSAPIVAGIAGLMLAVNGNLTSGQLIARLQLGATTPFPTDPGIPVCHVPASASDLQTNACSCTTDTCGAGMANAHGAVLQALRPIAAVSLPALLHAGMTVALDGSGSAAACGAKIVAYQWTLSDPASGPAIQNADTAHASITAPAAPGVYQLMLTVTDDAGRTDTAPVIITPTRATSAAPAQAGTSACLVPVSYNVGQPPTQGAGSPAAGGGGGGTIDPATVLAVLAMLIWALPARYVRRCASSSHSRCARR